MSGAHAPLLDGFPHGHAGMGEVHNGLLVGVSTFQPARTHWAFFAYVVMLSCFAVYIFADPVHFPSRLNGPDKIDFAFKVNASVHTLFVLLAFALAKVMRAGHKAQKRLGHIRLHSKLKPYVVSPFPSLPSPSFLRHARPLRPPTPVPCWWLTPLFVCLAPSFSLPLTSLFCL